MLNDTKRFHTFVANRVSVIRDLSKGKQGRYLNSKHNPADEASRHYHVKTFLKSKRWLKDQNSWRKQKHNGKKSPRSLALSLQMI
jgi:hypothetical protein